MFSEMQEHNLKGAVIRHIYIKLPAVHNSQLILGCCCRCCFSYIVFKRNGLHLCVLQISQSLISQGCWSRQTPDIDTERNVLHSDKRKSRVNYIKTHDRFTPSCFDSLSIRCLWKADLPKSIQSESFACYDLSVIDNLKSSIKESP